MATEDGTARFDRRKARKPVRWNAAMSRDGGESPRRTNGWASLDRLTIRKAKEGDHCNQPGPLRIPLGHARFLRPLGVLIGQQDTMGNMIQD